jgi:hypothetical protein
MCSNAAERCVVLAIVVNDTEIKRSMQVEAVATAESLSELKIWELLILESRHRTQTETILLSHLMVKVTMVGRRRIVVCKSSVVCSQSSTCYQKKKCL